MRGFLEGVAISASEKLNGMTDDLQEILKDLVEICQLDPRVEQSESGEKEFFEISEYVRIGVLNLYAEFNQPHVEEKKSEAQAESIENTKHNPTLH